MKWCREILTILLNIAPCAVFSNFADVHGESEFFKYFLHEWFLFIPCKLSTTNTKFHNNGAKCKDQPDTQNDK